MADNRTVDLGATLPPSARETLRPTPDGLESFVLVGARIRDGDDRLQVGAVLGEGGIGVVRLARQLSLGREVAAKQLKASAPGSVREQRLLQEAWVLGRLEHPNIVPVHDVLVDADGRLTLLMKRIEGQTWTRWMADPSGVCEAFGVTDALDWHLGVLEQVCHALAFAHDRGVVHRDLKPDNVMIGQFGEVVLLDWGIAAGLPGGTIASRPAPGQVAGTPHYMAPEMWTAPERVSPTMDVYLVGGILYELLTGSPPHPGGAARADAVPQLPANAPAELATLVRDCLAVDPAARPQSAEAVRRQIAVFKQHRGSLTLTDDADRRAARLLADPDQPERLLDEARFGYLAALAQWPDNARAKQGLAAMIEALARLRLQRGDPRGAARLLADLDAHAASDLRSDVARALADKERLEALGRRSDPTVGARGRATMITFLALIWASIPVTGHFLIGGREPTRATVYGFAVALFIVTALGVFSARASIRHSALSRQLVAWVLLTPVLQGVQAWGLDRLGIGPHGMQSAQFFVWGTMCSAAAVAVDRRLALPGLAFLVAYLFAVRAPELRYLIMAGPTTILAATVLWIYHDAARKGDT